MAKIEDIDSWFAEFKEEMFTLFDNFSEELTNRLQQIYADVMKLDGKIDRFIDETNRQHEEMRQEILSLLNSPKQISTGK
jgi:hypothetical protein